MENITQEDQVERVATVEEREYIQRMLGNYGLYDASLDLDNPNIVESVN